MAWTEIIRDKRYLAAGASVVVIAFIAVILAVSGSFGSGSEAKATPTPQPNLLTLKTDSVLLDLVQVYRIGGVDEAQRFARDRGIITKDERVRLTLVLDTEDITSTKAKLQELGATVDASNANYLTASAPLSFVLEKAKDISNPGFFDGLAGLEHVVEIRVPAKPVPDSADAMSQGVKVTGADRWHAAGITGKGVKVGIMDGGFQGYQDLLGIGLPQKVTLNSFTSDGDIAPAGSEHGTAVGEIIHEMAPDAELYMVNFDSDADWLNAVDWLVSQGVKVISQSMGDATSPFDGTGIKGKKIDEARAKGVLWVNSSGNYAQAHYAADFKPDADGWHEFSPGKNRMRVVPDGSGTFTLILNWRDWTKATVDYDLYLYNSKNEPVASSRDVQSGKKAPLEMIYFRGAVKNETYSIGIKVKDPTKVVAFDLFNFRGLVEIPVVQGSINAYSSAKGAFAVGALHWRNDKLEPYSSQGPTWDGRMKPDISGPSVVDSLVYGREGFNGTSAAAPHVAGAAALVFSASPTFTPEQVAQFLQSNAVDLGSVGLVVRDSRFGVGRLALGPVPKGR